MLEKNYLLYIAWRDKCEEIYKKFLWLGIHLAVRRVVTVYGSVKRNGGPRTAVLTVDRIYFLAGVRGLVVDPGRLHLPVRFCGIWPEYIYAFNDFQICTFLPAFVLAIENIMEGKSFLTLPADYAYLFNIYQPRAFCCEFATNRVLQRNFSILI